MEEQESTSKGHEGEFKDLKVDAEAISKLPDNLRYADIVGYPVYNNVKDLSDPNKMIEKLVIPVKLSDGSLAKYYPNGSSAQFLASRLGTKFSRWIGQRMTWGKILDQNVRGTMRKVLYITDVADTPVIDL